MAAQIASTPEGSVSGSLASAAPAAPMCPASCPATASTCTKNQCGTPQWHGNFTHLTDSDSPCGTYHPLVVSTQEHSNAYGENFKKDCTISYLWNCQQSVRQPRLIQSVHATEWNVPDSCSPSSVEQHRFPPKSGQKLLTWQTP